MKSQRTPFDKLDLTSFILMHEIISSLNSIKIKYNRVLYNLYSD